MSRLQLSLTAAVGPEPELELVDGDLVDEIKPAVSSTVPSSSPPPSPFALEQRNLFGEAERIAARAASASTRRQYAAIFGAFGDWLAAGVGHPPGGWAISTPM